ncbi:hypothetical protein KM043_010431 [Ampulex compressa]|nr:hypothetical protein KM043_010431 [Ampulex compressa]
MSVGTLRFVLRSPVLRQCQLRHGHYLRGKPPLVARSLRERLDSAKETVDAALSLEVNIGFHAPKISRKNITDSWMAEIKSRRTNPDIDRKLRNKELMVDMDQLDIDWLKTSAPRDVHRIAKHYGIFRDLFGDAYFHPVLPLRVDYTLDDDTLARAYQGNVIKPIEASRPPMVGFDAEEDSLWTLIMSTPDGNMRNVTNEYCHWFIGNIPGNRISAGEQTIDYLRPITPPGVGYYRYIFVLYKQNGRIDYTCYKKTQPCLELEERDWNTLEFYRKHQDCLTPAGLVFFQADWDPSVTHFYHDTLQMKEPRFRYDFPKPYIRRQEWFPLKQPFNLYLDKYRDPKEINKEFFLKKLKNVHPFKAPEPPLKYPNAYPLKSDTPSWLMLEKKKERLQWGRINEIRSES